MNDGGNKEMSPLSTTSIARRVLYLLGQYNHPPKGNPA